KSGGGWWFFSASYFGRGYLTKGTTSMFRSDNKLAQFAIALILTGVSITAGAADPSRSFRFDIQNQPLAQALRNFGHVSGQEVVFKDELVRNVKSVTLRGEYTAAAALDRLLEGTGLV